MKKTAPRQRKKEIWAGTRRPLDVPMESETPVEAEIWVDTRSGQLRMLELVPAGSDLSSFSANLWRAITEPIRGETPYRPGEVVVDRPELAQALMSLAQEQKIQVSTEPAVAEAFDDVVEQMEAELADGPGYQFLADEDVDPALVAAFYEQANRYLDLEPWMAHLDSDWIAVEGLEKEPLFCSILGAGGEPGLAMCWTRAGAEEFAHGRVGPDHDIPSLAFMVQRDDELRPGLQGELLEHGWPRHSEGAAVLLRGDRPERPQPTNDELRLMTSVLEAVTLFLASQAKRSKKVKLATGQTVSVRYDKKLSEIVPEVDDDGWLFMMLDQLSDAHRLEEALDVAAGALYSAPYLNFSVLSRLVSYLLRLERYQELEDIWEKFAPTGPPEWSYVGALNAIARGKTALGKKRLKEGATSDLEVGKRILGLSSSPDDDFAEIWRPLWQANPEAMNLLAQAAR